MSAKTGKASERRWKRSRHARASAGIPYTMKLDDGRTLFVEVPARMAVQDRSAEIAFTPEGVRFLDHVRALASGFRHPPSPAFIAAIREAVGLTQEQLGKRLGKHKLTISRWERGAMRPSRKSTQALAELFGKLKRSGVVLPE